MNTAKMIIKYGFAVCLVTGFFILGCSSKKSISLLVKNTIGAGRPNATITLPLGHIPDYINKPREFLRVYDNIGNEIVSQLLDDDEDGFPDHLLFKTSIAAKEEQHFTILNTNKQDKEWESLVHAKYVPEGMEDFNWENDRIGYRFYGEARLVEGISSGIDVWCKRVPYRMIENWYDPGINYHDDSGKGADHYRVKDTRGCGGTALWNGEKMIPSGPFSEWRIIAAGPLRTIFELSFPAVVIGERIVSESKCVSLDGGEFLNRIDITYNSSESGNLNFAVGIGDHSGSIAHYNEKKKLLWTWESLGEGKGELGCAVILDNDAHVFFKRQDDHYLLYSSAEIGKSVTYYTGACWSEYGTIQNAEEWKAYLFDWYEKKKQPMKIDIISNEQ